MEYIEGSGDKEKESISRKVVLHFVRHGAAEYSGRSDAEGYLTSKGKEQAIEAAEKLYQQLPDGVILDFLSSNRRRAVETAEAIKRKVQEIECSQSKHIIFHNNRRKEMLIYSRLGMSDDMTQEALDLKGQGKKEINHWLNNPGKTSSEIEKNFFSFLRHMLSFAHQLGDGTDIHIVIVTHTGPSEVFVGKLLNKNTMESLENCEEFTIALPTSEKQITVNFRDIKQEVPLYD